MRYSILLFLLFPLFLMSQPFQGQKFTGGSLDISLRSFQNDDTSASFSINPVFGGMLSDRFAIGGLISYGLEKRTKNEFLFIHPVTGLPVFGNNNSQTTSLSFESFVSWYYPLKGKLGFKLTTGIKWRYMDFRLTSPTITTGGGIETYQITARISPSLYYFADDQFVILASLGGLRLGKSFSDQADDSTFFNASLRSGSFFGIRYFWGGGE